MSKSSILLKKPSRTYSPLRYPGGKAMLSHFLFDIISTNNITDCVYAEPFAGGAGAALTLLMWEKVNRIIINDYDRGIFAFWNSVVNNSEAFLDKLETTEVSQDEWFYQKKIYQNPDSSELDLGFATFFLNRTNHSGIIDGRPIGGNSQSGRWKIDARFNRTTLANRVKRISLYKDRIEVKKSDGIELMRQIYQIPNILVYIDPPYYMKGKSLYLNHYNSEDHKELSIFLNNNPDFNWILTYDSVPEVTSLYSERSQFSFGLYYHTNTPKIGKEVLIKADVIKFSQQLSLNLELS